MMERTVAFLVGIEEYAHAAAPPLRSPCRDALLVARRLRALGVPAANLHLFLQPARRDAAQQAELDGLLAELAGADFRPSCAHAEIERFWREELPRLPDGAASQQLFVYWSGHGFTPEAGGAPYLLCSDCTEALAQRVVDRRELLESLLADAYLGFRTQLVVIDACANVRDWRGRPGTTQLSHNAEIDQMAFGAAARGQYAHADAAGGRFTHALLAALGGGFDWADLDAFRDSLRQEVANAGLGRAVTYQRSRGDLEDWASPVTVAALAELHRRLGRLNLAPHRYLPLYQLARSSPAPLRREPTADEDRILVILRDLWNANGRQGAPEAPYPVVEFVLRVRQAFPALAAESLDEWLANEDYVLPALLAEAQRRLASEESTLFLEVELVESTSPVRPGEHVEMNTRLLRFDRATALEPWPQQGPLPVTSWNDVEVNLLPLVVAARELAAAHGASLSVEFLTNLFDIDPHLIVLDEELGVPTLLGGEHPVVLRWRSRPPNPDGQRVWRERAAQIRESARTSVRGVDVESLAAGPEPPPEYRLLFVRHALRKDSGPQRTRPLTPEWKLAMSAIKTGTPFLCWPREEPGAGGWAPVERAIEGWFQPETRLEDVPARVQSERARGGPAANVSLFWDDPLLTWQLREIRTGAT